MDSNPGGPKGPPAFCAPGARRRAYPIDSQTGLDQARAPELHVRRT